MTEPTDRPNFFRLESAELVAFARRSQATIVPPSLPPPTPSPLHSTTLLPAEHTSSGVISPSMCPFVFRMKLIWPPGQGPTLVMSALDFQLALAVNDSQPHLSPDHNLPKFDGVTNRTEGTRTGTFSNWQTHIPKQRVQLMVQGSTREVLAFGFHSIVFCAQAHRQRWLIGENSISRDKTPYLTETLAMVQTFRTITS